MEEKTKYLLALSLFQKFGPVRIKKLKKYFKDEKSAFSASTAELKKAGIEEKIINEFISSRPKIDLEKVINILRKEKISLLTLEDDIYPKLLKEIYDPPPLLYYRGTIKKDDEYNIAVVGTRNYTNYGRQVTEKIVKELTLNKISISSGMALGIDTLAHKTCLDSGGYTIAVLGTGLDWQSIYPSQNRYLADKIIASGGAVISEFPMGTPPLRHHFPQRNRIIAGLSLGSLVIEAAAKSGALITARFALEQNRDVFSVPGSILSTYSEGPNNLIAQGAHVTRNATDIMEALDLSRISSYINNKKIIGESKEEEALLTHLGHEPLHVDELIRLTKLNVAIINSTLTLMEMKGMVRNLGNMLYVLAR